MAGGRWWVTFVLSYLHYNLFYLHYYYFHYDFDIMTLPFLLVIGVYVLCIYMDISCHKFTFVMTC